MSWVQSLLDVRVSNSSPTALPKTNIKREHSGYNSGENAAPGGHAAHWDNFAYRVTPRTHFTPNDEQAAQQTQASASNQIAPQSV